MTSPPAAGIISLDNFTQPLCLRLAVTTDPLEQSSEPQTAAAERDHPHPIAPLPAHADGCTPVEPAGEETIWTARTHWRHFFGLVSVAGAAVIAVCVLLAVVASRFQWSGLATFYIGLLITLSTALAVGGWIMARVLRQRYRLTGQRLFIERGILSQTIDQTELIRVDDVRVRKTVVDRVFGLGSIDVLSTDVTDRTVVMEGVKNADEVAEHVRTRMRALRSRSLFVERL